MEQARRRTSSTIYALSLISAAIGFVPLVALQVSGARNLLQLPGWFWQILPAICVMSTWGIIIPNFYVGLLSIFTASLMTLMNPILTLIAFFTWPGEVLSRAVVAAVAGSAGSGVLSIIFFICHRDLRLSWSWRLHLSLQLEALHDLPLLYALTGWLWIERLVLGATFGPADLGRFVAAASLVQFVVRVPQAVLSNVFVSATTHTFASGPSGGRKLIHLKVQVMRTLVSVFVLLIAPYMSTMMNLLYGRKFGSLLIPIFVLFIGALAGSISTPLATSLAGLGLGSRMKQAGPGLVLVQIVLLYVLSRRFGINGAATAESLFLVLLAGMIYMMSRRAGLLSEQVFRSWAPLGLALAGIVVELLLQLSPASHAALAVGPILAIAFGICFLPKAGGLGNSMRTFRDAW